MALVHAALGVALGALAALWHLGTTHMRARRALQGRSVLWGLATAPLSIVVPALLLVFSATRGLVPLLASLVAFSVVQMVILRRFRKPS